MTLSPRLKKIFDCVPVGSGVADIGTDHGYLVKALLDEKKSVFAVASDVNAQPLAKAAALLKKYADAGAVSLRLGSGLSVLKSGECDTIIMAGMGGYLMRDLILAEKEIARQAKKLILQPMNNAAVLRYALAEFGFLIVEEHIVTEENKFYEIIAAIPGEMKIESEADAILGYAPVRRDSLSFRRFLDYQIQREEKILAQLEGKTSDAAFTKRENSKALLNRFREIKDECTSEENI